MEADATDELRITGFPSIAPGRCSPGEAYAPHVFERAGTLAGASGFIGCAAAIVGSLWRARQARFVTTYGSAHWAEPGEIERAGLLRDSGVKLR